MLRRLVLVLALVLAPIGCSAAREPVPSPQVTGTPFNTTDVAWLQLAEALHTRTQPLLELASERAGSRSLAELAGRLGEAHEAGRERLRTLLVRAGGGGENPHAGHDMPGMPTAQDLEQVTGLRDDAFDRRFTELTRSYLEQLVLIANGERGSGGAAEVRELAGAMSRTHAAELAQLQQITAP
ncbi:DUF305 domain-containing protein [Nonomuraea antimicrobica]|uniref:DUF305 domain-containing protein n=1 Tax=Nonomuraea antimicrobica TaxID=561173 RepID=A0ABP7C9T7_9ACTN